MKASTPNIPTLNHIQSVISMSSLWRYLIQILVAVDQLANAILWGAPDETLSSRAYRADRDGKILGRVLRPLIDLMFFFDPDHCRQAYLAEVHRRQYSKAFR